MTMEMLLSEGLSRLNRRRDVDYLPTSKDAGQEIPSPFFGHPPVEGQIRPGMCRSWF